MLISKVNATRGICHAAFSLTKDTVAFTLKIVYHLLGGDFISKHLTLSDRITIATGLKEQKPINQIAKELGKDCSTISREIRKHITRVDKGAAHRVSNRCVHEKHVTAMAFARITQTAQENVPPAPGVIPFVRTILRKM